MAALLTLQTWLTEAETARHALLTGTMSASVSYEGRYSVTYAKTEIDKLDAYIASLRSQIAAQTGEDTPRLRPIHLTF